MLLSGLFKKYLGIFLSNISNSSMPGIAKKNNYGVLRDFIKTIEVLRLFTPMVVGSVSFCNFKLFLPSIGI